MNLSHVCLLGSLYLLPIYIASSGAARWLGLGTANAQRQPFRVRSYQQLEGREACNSVACSHTNPLFLLFTGITRCFQILEIDRSLIMSFGRPGGFDYVRIINPPDRGSFPLDHDGEYGRDEAVCYRGDSWIWGTPLSLYEPGWEERGFGPKPQASSASPGRESFRGFHFPVMRLDLP